jgi:hypothetical protein
MTIEGHLRKPVSLTPAPIPPPPNANTPNCMINSQKPGEPIWTITKFLYMTTKRGFTNHFGSSNGELFPFNRTLEIVLRNDANGYTQSCVINDPAIDNATDKWWPCFRERAPHTFAKRAIETYVQFNKDTGLLRINQTWYCNDTQKATPCVYLSFSHVLVTSFPPSFPLAQA